jgi:anti-anti-sigma factor
MDIHISYEQSRVPVTVLKIDGAIDSSNYQELDQLAASSIDQGTRYLLLDLSAVRFMSSAALRSLQKIDRKLNALANGINEAAVQKGLLDGTYKSPFLKLVNPTEPVLLTLKTAGWDMIFDIFKDKKMAVGSF